MGTLWLFNIAMEAMAHLYRWFTELKNGWIFHCKLLVITSWWIIFPKETINGNSRILKWRYCTI